jgi:hypothetical protein
MIIASLQRKRFSEIWGESDCFNFLRLNKTLTRRSPKLKPLLIDFHAPLRPTLLMDQLEPEFLVKVPRRIQPGKGPKIDLLVTSDLAEIHSGAQERSPGPPTTDLI